jgi:serine/threonine-protein kinase
MSSVRTPETTAPLALASFESCAVALGFVSAEQADECRALHQALLDMGLPSTVAEVFVKKGYLQPTQVVAIESALGRGTPDAIPGYEIIEKIAEGGMGAVYKARQVSMDRVVALKVLLPKFADRAEGRERFVREARAVAKLSHPNVVAGIDAGEVHGVYYFVMEYIDGEPTDQVLRRCGRLPWREAVTIVRQMALALQHAQEHGIVHRDIKPANIMLLKDGRAKLADLGLARVASTGDATLTQSGMIVGSPAYLSPEQATAEGEVDIRSDLYSLGLTLFEFIAGERAYVGANPMSVLTALLTRDVPLEKLAVADAPRDVVAVIRHLTQRLPERRYQTPAELLEDLDAVLAGQRPKRALAANASLASASSSGLLRAAPAALLGPAATSPARWRARWLGVGLVLAAALTLVLLVAWPWRDAPTSAPPRPIASTAPQVVRFDLIEALARAQREAGDLLPFHAELERSKYSIDFAHGRATLNVVIDGDSGEVIEKVEEDEDHSADVTINRIPLSKAVQAAQKLVPGQAVDAEIVLLPGRAVVAVKVLRDGERIVVNVDGTSGVAELAPKD